MYRCIIIDDEQHAIEALERYVGKLPHFELVASFTDPLLALHSIDSLGKIDLILLDIDMPNINGIELSRSLRSKTDKLIFTTGHSKYGYEAFKVDADDYLLKPYTLSEFFLSINKIFPAEHKMVDQTGIGASFFIKSKEENLKMLNIKFNDVVAVESRMNYVLIHTRQKKITTYMTLSEMSVILARYPGFQKFQRSFIIAEQYIESITGNCIRMITGAEITVGDYYRKDFTRFVAERLLKTGRR